MSAVSDSDLPSLNYSLPSHNDIMTQLWEVTLVSVYELEDYEERRNA